MMVERTHALNALHRMMQATVEDSEVRSRLATDRNTVFTEFGLSDEEVKALDECTFAGLAEIGMHPMYRMHWMMLANPGMASFLSVDEYVDKAKLGTGDG